MGISLDFALDGELVEPLPMIELARAGFSPPFFFFPFYFVL